MGIFASIEQAYSLRIAERDAQIATLTAENERLRALVEDAYYEGNNDAVYEYGRDWLGSDSAAALPPTENTK